MRIFPYEFSYRDAFRLFASDPPHHLCSLPILLKISGLRVGVSHFPACGTRIALRGFEYGREIYTTQRSSSEKGTKTANNARSIAYSVQRSWRSEMA
jgi:hypothetical protein